MCSLSPSKANLYFYQEEKNQTLFNTGKGSLFSFYIYFSLFVFFSRSSRLNSPSQDFADSFFPSSQAIHIHTVFAVSISIVTQLFQRLQISQIAGDLSRLSQCGE
ncbi:hypothetical protein L1987_35490 [Smallanthus sonchifolius]|uniref:Uncharacterized protein n=1 Tax=Smallanthus sonchifolius TaxID=185202 RepID=A0ACB9HYH0_9ASTR|nr:hypothetical protein L1987_35490 [Smallanthus sonchifolius]